MKNNHEVIMCVVNAGFSEAVMDAAREFGARGGTVINARGTANIEAEKIFNISIQPEKELVMILVDKTIRDDILHAIYQKVGLQSEGKGIAFCLPVEEVVGLSQNAAVNMHKNEETKKGENADEHKEAKHAAGEHETANADENANDSEDKKDTEEAHS